jgi:hypothetical protein
MDDFPTKFFKKNLSEFRAFDWPTMRAFYFLHFFSKLPSHHRFTDLNVNSTVINFKLGHGLDDSKKRFCNFLFTQKLSREGISFQNFLVVHRHWDETHFRNFSMDKSVEDNIKNLESWGQYFASS